NTTARAHVIACNDPQSENEENDGVGANVSMMVDKSCKQIELEPLDQSPEDADLISDAGDGMVQDEDVACLSQLGRRSKTINQLSLKQSPLVDPCLHKLVHRRGSSRGTLQSPIKRNTRSACSGSGLEEHLTAFFDRIACKKQENENGMTQFCHAVNRLRTSDHSKVTSLQEKMTELKIENQALKSK
ncbi:hypothetical protein VP01_9336g1, partial [Puccinia sorghi]